MRWRLRGAWLWPAFAALTILDTVMIRVLPLAGEGATAWMSAFLLSGSINLIVVAALHQAGGWALRRRRPDLPKVVADNYAGTALLLTVTMVFLAFGLLHRPAVTYERDAEQAALVAAHEYIAANAPAAHRRRAGELTRYRVDRDLYRVCAPGDDPLRDFCVFVTTAEDPPGIRVDPNRETNESFDGLREQR